MMIKNKFACFCSLIVAVSCFNLGFADTNPTSITAPPPSQVSTLTLPSNTNRLPIVPSSPDTDAKAYILIDANSGKVLAQKNADQTRPPASLTKMMTLYLTLQAMHSGQIQPTTQVPISQKAWRMGGSKMFVKVNSHVPVDDLIRGVIVDSGNDACVALAEYLGGSENAFVGLMNQEAQALGMTSTHFTDSTGLPNPDHYTTAKDMAILTRALIQRFPEYYAYFSQKSLTYSGIKQYNRNRLLWRNNLNVDGLKTGHTDAAGFCLVSSAKNDDQRLIAVVMGAPSDNARTQDSAALLTYGMRFFETHQLYDAQTAIGHVRVYKGEQKTVNIGLANPAYVTILKGQYDKLSANMVLDQGITAPVTKGQVLGQLQIALGDHNIDNYPLLALEADPVGNIWRRFTDSIIRYFHKLFGKKATQPTPMPVGQS